MPPRRVRAESRARYFIREHAQRRGWNTAHLGRGGDFLEENEIEAHYPGIGLAGGKPDFLVCLAGEPHIVVEAKNDARKLGQAIQEACDYADQIIAHGRFAPRIAVGAAGEEDAGFLVEVRYRTRAGWEPLLANGQAITSIPSPRETELAIVADDATTTVSAPEPHEFIDAAMEISSLLRTAKVEAPLRPKVLGAVTLAMYQGAIDIVPAAALGSINGLVEDAIRGSADLGASRKDQLADALHLSHADFDRLTPRVGRIIAILRKLNIRSVLHTDTDFLGMFYEAFLRYGYDNNALGIVFTPRHVTRFCAELIDAKSTDKVIDIACGTGGFLVAAFDRMLASAPSAAAVQHVKRSLAGFDANPTVWSLAMLNMFFRGDGKSNIVQGDSLKAADQPPHRQSYTKAFLNPPFSQAGEPEYRFIDISREALAPEGLLAAVVYAGVFADEDHAQWRRGFLAKHSLLGMISLPEDLFYPTAAPTTVMIAKAHVPQAADADVLMGRIWNDGYVKLKSRRVEAPGSQLPALAAAFERLQQGQDLESELAVKVKGQALLGGSEWSPQQWLPQPHASAAEVERAMRDAARSVFQAVAKYPDVADEALDDFCGAWSNLPPLPLGTSGPITDYFQVVNGKSSGEKNYQEGATPYISSGDAANSIVGQKAPIRNELFADGALTVTAFGAAALQPWPFLARGNGGSSVRVLQPRFRMSETDLLWFAAQINLQRWRFFYARMSIKSRLERLVVEAPRAALDTHQIGLSERIRRFRTTLDAYSRAVVDEDLADAAE